MARNAAPSGGADAVRRSLDAQAVDPESEDRPYLVSMLRRLGYTDAQIQDYLAGRAEPGAPVAAPAKPAAQPAAEPGQAHAESESSLHAHVAPDSHAHVVADGGEERDIEVEYTGPGLQDYRIVDPVDFFADQNLVEFEAGTPAPAEESWESADETGSDGQPLAEFTHVEEAPVEEMSWEPVPEEPAEETPWPTEEQPSDVNLWPTEGQPAEEPPWPAEDATLAEAPAQESAWGEEAAWPEESPAQPEDQTIHYGDYTLYQAEEVRDGHAARVYAFSKTPPGQGYEAANEVPDGYQVAENPETGRPFLRRIGDEDWGLAEAAGLVPGGGPQGGADDSRRRVRLKRVRAANREEAMRVIEREGGTPLASVPIDIEKRLGDE